MGTILLRGTLCSQPASLPWLRRARYSWSCELRYVMSSPIHGQTEPWRRGVCASYAPACARPTEREIWSAEADGQCDADGRLAPHLTRMWRLARGVRAARCRHLAAGSCLSCGRDHARSQADRSHVMCFISIYSKSFELLVFIASLRIHATALHGKR